MSIASTVLGYERARQRRENLLRDAFDSMLADINEDRLADFGMLMRTRIRYEEEIATLPHQETLAQQDDLLPIEAALDQLAQKLGPDNLGQADASPSHVTQIES